MSLEESTVQRAATLAVSESIAAGILNMSEAEREKNCLDEVTFNLCYGRVVLWLRYALMVTRKTCHLLVVCNIVYVSKFLTLRDSICLVKMLEVEFENIFCMTHLLVAKQTMQYLH